MRIVKAEVYRTGNKVGPWREALDGLHKLGSAEAVKAIGEAATRSRDQFVRGRADKALRKLSNPAGLEQLGQLALVKDNPSTRYNVIQGLANFRSDRAVALLSTAYQQEPTRNILLSMGKTGHTNAIPILMDVVLGNKGKREFRYSAAKALSLIGPPSTPSLLREWNNSRKRDTDSETRLVLLYAASGIGDSRLLVLWKEVFDMTAQTARESRWGTCGIPEWETRLARFNAGMIRIGEDALPYLKQLHEKEQHDRLRQGLARLIEQIRSAKSTVSGE